MKQGKETPVDCSFTLSRYGLRLASMTAENEIVMVGGTSYSTGEVFSTMKVMSSSEKEKEKISHFLFMKMSSHSDLF